jgi:hypothetical protein
MVHVIPGGGLENGQRISRYARLESVGAECARGDGDKSVESRQSKNDSLHGDIQNEQRESNLPDRSNGPCRFFACCSMSVGGFPATRKLLPGGGCVYAG